MSRLYEVGPLRVGRHDVIVRTNSWDFASVARAVFVDLVASRESPLPHPVVFETIEHSRPELHWSIHRDGEPCELRLRDDAVIVQLQWEFNRLVIECQPAVIHAAAAEREGRAVLLAGRSHSGKTTLAGWLIGHHGWKYLTDEASAIDERSRVVPYPRPMGLRPDSPLARVALGLASRFMPEEVLVPATDNDGPIAMTPAPVDLIVFPRFLAESRLTVASLNQADTFERLLHLTPGLIRHGPEVFVRLGTMVLGSPAITITYPHVSEAAAALVDLGRR